MRACVLGRNLQATFYGSSNMKRVNHDRPQWREDKLVPFVAQLSLLSDSMDHLEDKLKGIAAIYKGLVEKA